MEESQQSSGSSSSITLQLLYEEILNQKKINIGFLQTVQQLEEENATLRSMVTSLENKLNWREQKQMEGVIEIVGVPEVNNDNAVESAQKMFSAALNVSVSADQIQNCYVKRISNINATSNPNETK